MGPLCPKLRPELVGSAAGQAAWQEALAFLGQQEEMGLRGRWHAKKGICFPGSSGGRAPLILAVPVHPAGTKNPSVFKLRAWLPTVTGRPGVLALRASCITSSLPAHGHLGLPRG